MHSEDGSCHSEPGELNDIIESETKNAKNSSLAELSASNLRGEIDKTGSEGDNERANKDGFLIARQAENAMTATGKSDALDLQNSGGKNRLTDYRDGVDDDLKYTSESGSRHNSGDASSDILRSIQERDGVSDVGDPAGKTSSLPDDAELRNRSGGSSKVKVKSRPKRSVRKLSSGSNKRAVVVNGKSRPYSPGDELEAKKISKIVARKL